MVELFLSEPNWKADEGGGGDFGRRWVKLLNELESVLWSLITSGVRSEARLWLSSAISGINPIAPHQQREVFVKLLRARPVNQGLATQLLQMMFERMPRKAGSILAKRSYMLEKFFEGHPKRILQWFANFGMEHKKGAKALSQFAFVNRDICWEELEWKGKHGQSPAVVATKPHYLLDLDVQRTVENFLDNVPEFWSSGEFTESLKDGDILSIDNKFFVEFFLGLMYKDDVKDVWAVVSEFLSEESFSSLCHHLLITLEEQEFCKFLELLGNYVKPKMGPNDVDGTTYWLELLICKFSGSKSIDQLLLINGIINQGRQLVRLVHDEEFQDERDKIKDTLSQICIISRSANSLVPLLNECIKSKIEKVVKLLGLQSWTLHYALSEECHSPQSWESVFSMNHVSFRKSDKYGMLDDDDLLEGNDSSDDKASNKRKQRKKKKSRKKRKRNFDDDKSYDDELLEFETSSDRLSMQSTTGSWLLSTDGFYASWTSADLPEYLAKFCFCTWMKWASSRSSDVP